MYTNHAQIRLNQRGISREICELLLIYGDKKYDGHGGIIRFFSEKSISRIISDKGIDFCKKNIKSFKTYLVKSLRDDGIITVGIAYKNHKFKSLANYGL